MTFYEYVYIQIVVRNITVVITVSYPSALTMHFAIRSKEVC